MKRHREHFSTVGWLFTTTVLLAASACNSSTNSKGDIENPPSDDGELAINAAANDTDVHSPFDATPSPDGKDVYYIGLHEVDGETTPGIFKVAAKGGAIEEVASGAPLGAPVGVTISIDGSTLYVADPGSDAAGAVLTVSADGGTPQALAGTSGYYPAGVVVANVNERETLYFTGTDPRDGARGLFSVPAAGGGVTAVASGSPFVEPGGVIVDHDGIAYVADSLASNGLASVVRVGKEETTLFVENIGVGFPAGITLTKDEATLVVSGLDPKSRSDVVYFVDVDSREISSLTDPVGAFHEAAGLHRAHEADVFAWADREANETGTVYVLAQ